MSTLRTDQPLTLIQIEPDALARLMEEASERGVQRALEKREADTFLSSEQAAQLLGYRYTDGRPNLQAFKAFRQRHPAFRALAVPHGRLLRWRRSDVERWMSERRKQPGVRHAK